MKYEIKGNYWETLEIRKVTVHLNGEATIVYYLRKEGEELKKAYTIRDEEYNNWGEDDQYIADLCLSREGVSNFSIVEESEDV